LKYKTENENKNQLNSKQMNTH